MNASIGTAAPAAARPVRSERTRSLLEHPILPTLLRLAWPNMLVMLAQASTGLIETWWVGHLGTEALAGMALVFPGVMLMQMLSGGSIGGGISSAVARALGRGERQEADGLVLHALLINAVLGVLTSVAMLTFGAPLYRLLGGEGRSLEAALSYSNMVFGGGVLLWVVNALASVVRGTGNMLVPALVTCAGVVMLLPLSPLLIFGLGPLPGLGVAGGGLALVLMYLCGTVFLGWYVLSGRNLARLCLTPLRWRPTAEILRVGAVGSISSLQANVTVASATALVGTVAGSGAIAGFGTGVRLEYLLIPLVFGLGAPLVALVGTNMGAGQHERALRIAWIGAALSFALTEAIGVAAALFPRAWLSLFGADPGMLDTGSAYLRAVGPFYGFFGFGLALYFASQGAGRLLWPLIAGLLRLVIGIGGGFLLLRAGFPLISLFVALGAGLLVYGVVIAVSIKAGVWFAGGTLRNTAPS
jgi:putative MATE family efflux protein